MYTRLAPSLIIMISTRLLCVCNKIKILPTASTAVTGSGIELFRRNLATLNKMADPQWQIEKNRLLNLSLNERRKHYRVKDYIAVNSVETWKSYVSKNKGVEEKKHTLDDVRELKKININCALNKSLSEKVSVFKGDITKLEVDAIVNAANSRLRAGGGVDGAIHKVAGPLLQEECNTLNGCPTGEAKITGGYGLPARYVIATVGPQDGSPTKLESCYKNCLALTTEEEYNIKSVAFPCISTGIYGFPNRLAAHIALRSARTFLEKHEHIERVIFCTFMPIDVDIYESLMQLYFPVHE